MREIVRGLLDFACESPMVMRSLDVNEVVRQVLALVGRQKEFKKISVREDLRTGALPSWGDRNRLQQVFLNLFLNAAQAMPEKGTMTVTTGLRDGKVVVSVADTGCGISKADREHIFEPFFTTKPVGMGTGLGLSVTYGIVRQHQGVLELESEEGKGSIFTVVLPRTEPDGVGK